MKYFMFKKSGLTTNYSRKLSNIGKCHILRILSPLVPAIDIKSLLVLMKTRWGGFSTDEISICRSWSYAVKSRLVSSDISSVLHKRAGSERDCWL